MSQETEETNSNILGMQSPPPSQAVGDLGRDKLLSRKITTNVTEKEFRVFNALSELLYQKKLIEGKSLYYFARYAMLEYSNLFVAALQQSKNQPTGSQTPKQEDKIK